MTTRAALQTKLEQGIDALGLQLPADAVTRLLDYLALLERWNAAYNLTAIRDPAEMVTRHLLDALAILPYVQGETLADLGTGPGLPGIPLAIAAPGRQVLLVDSNGKKVRFLREAIRALEAGRRARGAIAGGRGGGPVRLHHRARLCQPCRHAGLGWPLAGAAGHLAGDEG